MPGKNVGRGIKRHAVRGESLVGRLGVGLYHASARSAHSPDDHGALSLSLASRNRDKTLEECAGCGRVTGESDQSLAECGFMGNCSMR